MTTQKPSNHAQSEAGEEGDADDDDEDDDDGDDNATLLADLEAEE